MMKTSGSRRISSAIASRSASRMVMVTISVPAGTSGSGSAAAFGAAGAATGSSLGAGADCASAINIGPQFGGIGLGIVLRKIGSGVDDLAHLGVDGLQFLFAHLGRQQTVADLLDRVLVVADLVDLLAGAILRRIRHRMAAI